jgi:hypothetical protein
MFQTRTITSTFAPFAGFGGNATKVYKGEASAPFIPSVFAVYKKDKWAFSGNFAVTGGGGKATFNEGLGSFESLVSVVPGMLVAAGNEMVDKGVLPINIFNGTNKYSVDSYMRGKQMIFGLQLGATYRITDYLSAFAGVRMNYVSNGYEGHIRNIEANIGGGEMVNVNKYFSDYAKQARTAADAYLAANDLANYAKYDAIAKEATKVAGLTADKELDCDQTGWGVTPILGLDFKMNKWNIGVKYEFNTKLNVENQIVYTTLDELYHSSDIISLHCPLTEQTKYLINDYSISKMKDGVMIINTGRGQLIHTNALIEGLKNKKIGSAGLDVYEEESEYFYEDKSDRIIDDDVLARLLSFNNVIVTSHQAFFTREALANIAATTLENIRDFKNQKLLVNEVKLSNA